SQAVGVVQPGLPGGGLCSIGPSGAKILADERHGGIAHAPRRQERKEDDANPDGVARHRGTAEAADDSHKARVGGRADEVLERRGPGDAQNAPHDVWIQPEMRPPDPDSTVLAGQAVDLDQHARPSPDTRANRRSRYAHPRKRPDAEDQARPER